MPTEKCTRQLPAIRVSETTETVLMRLASRDDRTLSEYIRLTLDRHAFGHGASLGDADGPVSGFGALQRSADDVGGRR